MPPLAWDRVFETCVRRGGIDVVFVTGFAPALRVDWGLREFQVPRFSAEDVTAMAAELDSPETEHFNGYRSTLVKYGNDYTQFRVAAFGVKPATRVVIAARVPTDHIGGRDVKTQFEGIVSHKQLISTCAAQDAVEVVLVPGSPPLLRAVEGFHSLQAAPLNSLDLSVSVFPDFPYGSAEPYDELLDFGNNCIPDEPFRYAFFKWPLPELCLLMRKQLPALIQPFAKPSAHSG